MDNSPHTTFSCPVEYVLNLIGGKWKVLILHHLMQQTLRFNALQKRIPAVTQRMLTRQLRELEKDGVIHRKVYAQVPPKVEYSLTQFGHSLKPVLDTMHEWGLSYLHRSQQQ